MSSHARRYRWGSYKTTEFENLDPQKVIAVLPTAAIEQHGPHLPVGVDTHLNEGMLQTVEALLPGLAPDLDVRILPIQSVGKSNEHLHAPGTLTLPAELALSVWTQIGLSVARAGVRKLVIANSPGGNLDLISVLARELRVRARMLAVKSQWGNWGVPDGLYTDDEMRFGIHGGDVETSMMLHFRPDLVRMEKAIDFRSNQLEAIETFTHLRLHGPNPIGWKAQDLHLAGTVGNASVATAEKGAATVAHYTDRFIELLQDVHAFSLDRLWSPEG